MKKGIHLVVLSFLLMKYCLAQEPGKFKSWNPAADTLGVMEGQAWPREVKNFYDRLPAAAESQVRKEVWDLSRQTAGLLLRFQTDASDIVVKYIVSGAIQFPHMPATGVSGIDLYSKTIDGDWAWASGRYSFGDTIVYRFSDLAQNEQHVNNREYFLYLPLYNQVQWMDIAVPEKSFFKPLAARKDKPVVVYGTSIAQGGCASRPGLAWTNILSRKIDRPVINLGFSGNGRLEKELTGLLAQVDAKAYVLDCLPNLVGGIVSIPELKKRIVSSVIQLQKARPTVPILLTEHDGYTNDAISANSKKEYEAVNTALRAVVDSLLATGIKNMYLLSKEDIGQDIESMVDGVHPNDIGMMRYARAYQVKLKDILQEMGEGKGTANPLTQRRDARIYDWETRHNEVVAYNKERSPGLVLIGNSITHYWAGRPAAPIARGEKSWAKYFEKRNPLNLGFGWDRIENVLWRINHGELDSIAPGHIVLMIGTNNIGHNTNDEIKEGLAFLIQAIRARQPAAKLLVVGILPRRKLEERVVQLNKLIAGLQHLPSVKYADAGKFFLNKDGKINESLFTDGLHPNEEGYEKLGAFIDGLLGNW